MRYEHRILIGLTGAIGKMGPQSQIITNRVAKQIGLELGTELKQREIIAGDVTPTQLWRALNDELGIDPEAEISVQPSGGSEVAKITISSCNICPKKVGKYAIPATSCPVGGLVKGVCEVFGLTGTDATVDLVPGETCVVSIGITGNASEA